MMMYDLVIIGGGPAGVAAGVYAARKKIKSILITEEWGGQSAVSPDIQNFIGTPSLPGNKMANMFKKHLEAYKSDVLNILESDRVVSVHKKGRNFETETVSGKHFESRAVLVASGSHRRKLSVKGADELEHRGVMYCASCDAPLFSGQEVIVVGGGNAGFEAAQQLLEYASKVTLFQRGVEFKVDSVLVERVLKDSKMKAWTNTEIKEVKGDKFVESVTYMRNGKEKSMDVTGIFVEIGSDPNSDVVKGLVNLNKIGEIEVNCRNQRASHGGIWAAGDVSDVVFKQNNISMGDGIKALEDIYIWLQEKKHQ